MRAQGSIYRRPRSPFWWVRYSYKGRTHRESTKEKSRARAGEYLDRRLAEIGADALGLRPFVGPAADRIQVGQMFAALRKDLELRGLRSLAATANHLSHAAAAWGDWLLKETTSERIDQWISQQVNEGRLSPATLNRRLQLLRQALTLAADRGLLAQVPKVRKLSELGHERSGFFEHAEFEAVVSHLPDYLQDFCRFAYLSGWRKGAIASLMWADVDLDARVIRLRPEHDKAGSGQVLPLEGELWQIIKRREPERSRWGALAVLVFHHNTKPLRNFQKAWGTACRNAGVPNKLFHDFRRTAVRNLVRAGVPERVAMSVSGHKTRAVFDRYCIVSVEDMRAAQGSLQEHLEGQPMKRKVVAIR